MKSTTGITKIHIDRLLPNPWQTRMGEPDAEYIKTLALDIAANGLLQTPVGRLVDGTGKDAQIQLAFGHNRLAAYRWLYDLRDNSDIPGDWSSMPVDVRELSDEQMADMAWAENDKRQDFTPLERALAIRKRMEDFKWSQKDIAEHLRISEPRVSNALRLLNLPEDILQHVSTGEMSERAALSLLTLFDLPESLRKEAEEGYVANWKPSHIIQQAIDGMTSDWIREHIEDLVKHFSRDLHQAAWDLDYIFITSEAIYWPECRTCELRHKHLNVCTKPVCYEAKGRAWRVDYLQRASQASGILPLEADLGYYEVTHLEYRSVAQSIPASGCENLRLEYDLHARSGPFTLEGKGYPNATIVCRQKSGHCQCLKGLEILEAQQRRSKVQAIQDTPRVEEESSQEEAEPVQEDAPEPEQPEPAQPTAAELQELVKQEKRKQKEYARRAKDVQEQAVNTIADGLAADEPGAWRLIYDRICAGRHWEGRPNDVIELRKGIAEQLVEYHTNYTQPQEVPELLKKILIEAGLQTPVF